MAVAHRIVGRTVMIKLYTIAVILVSLGIVNLSYADTRQPELKSLSGYSRMIFPLNTNGAFKITNSGSQTAQLNVDHVRTDSWQGIENLNDERLESISVNDTGMDTAEIKLKFKNDYQDYFAYLQASPPAVIVDIWSKNISDNIASKKDQNVAKKIGRKIASISDQKKDAKDKNAAKAAPKNRLPASIGGAKVAEFVDPHPTPAPLSLEGEFFRRFKQPLPDFVRHGQKFSSPPETDLENRWTFGKSAEGKTDDVSEIFKLAIKLFKEKKYGLCIKSIEILERDHAKSPYVDEQIFLRALAYKKLSEAHNQPELLLKAEADLKNLMVNTDTSGKERPFALSIKLYFISKAYKNGLWLETIESLEDIVKTLGENDPDNPIISLVLANAYHQVGQNRRAERIYRYVAEKQRGNFFGKEAKYRIGDILAIESNHGRAVEEIESAIKTYPEYLKSRTEAYFNLGEAYFWLGKYDKSIEAFQKFVTQNPSQTIAGLAFVRMGEALELMSKPLDQARENYLQAINGFPFSEGAQIASLRLARANMTSEERLSYQLRTLAEMLSKPNQPQDLVFMAKLLLVQTHRYMNNPELAVKEALKVMTVETGSPYEIFKNQYVQAVGEQFAKLVEQKKYSEALEHNQRYEKWLEMFGPKSLRLLSMAYQGVGLFDSSNQYMNQYAAKQASDRGRSIASVVKPTELKNYFAQGNYQEVLRNIPEKPESLDQMEMAMTSHFRLGHYKDAYRFAAQIKDYEMELSDLALINYTEVQVHLAYEDKNYQQMESLLSKAKEKLKEPDERIDYLYADALWYQRKHPEAIKAYTEALKRYPSSERAERSKYFLGMSYVENGQRKEGVKILADLRDKSQSVWGKSAKQEYELLNWESKYSGILRGLPPSGLGVVK